MSDIVRSVVRKFWGGAAILLIALAALVQLGRMSTAYLENYNTELAAYFSSLTGMAVELGSVEGEWSGLLPSFEIRDLRLLDHSGSAALTISQAKLRLNIFDSLRSFRPIIDELTLSELSLAFEQNEEGRWWLSGMPVSTSKLDSNLPIDDIFDIFLLGPRIRLEKANLAFAFFSGHQSAIQVPIIDLENTEQFHRLSAGLTVAGREDAVQLIVEGHGDPRDQEHFSAQAWLRLHQLPTQRALDAIASFIGKEAISTHIDSASDDQSEAANTGLLNFELWVSSAGESGYSFDGQVGADSLPLDLARVRPELERLALDFNGFWYPDKRFSLSLLNVFVNDAQSIEPFNVQLSRGRKSDTLNIVADQLGLGSWYKFAESHDLLTGRLGEVMNILSPQGTLKNLVAVLPLSEPKQWKLSANLAQVSAQAWKGAPAVTQVDGYLQADQQGGLVDLNSLHGFSMHYPLAYKLPMVYSRAQGQVRWSLQPENNAIYVNSGLLNFSGEDGEAAAYFHVFAPWIKGSAESEMILQIGLKNSRVKYHEKYVPFTLPDSLENWLTQSIGGGELSDGGFLFRGSLTKGAADKRSIQLFLNMQNADLNYHPDWPSLSQVDALLTVDDFDVMADVETGKIYDSIISDTQVLVSPHPLGEGSLLNLQGILSGDASDGLRVLRESPIRKAIGGSLDTWVLQGESLTTLDLTVPLKVGEPGMRQNVEIALTNATLDMRNLRLNASGVNGLIRYSDMDGLQAEGLSAELWQRPIDIAISSPVLPSGTRNTLVSVEGNVLLETVSDWTRLPELKFLEGDSDFVAEVTIPARASADYFALLKVRSSLEGATLKLPAPFGKTADEAVAFSLEAPITAEGTVYNIHYGELANGLFAEQGGQLIRAGIALGEQASLPAPGIFAINGHAERFEFSAWNDVFKRYQVLRDGARSNSEGPGIQQTINLSFAEFDYEGYVIDGLDLNGLREEDSWQLNASSQMTAGKITVFDNAEKPLIFDMAFLRLPLNENDDSGQSVDALADVNLEKMVAVSFSTQEFSLGADSYGSWSFELEPDEAGVNISEIMGSVRGIDVRGPELDTGATMTWRASDAGPHTTFQGRLDMHNLADTLVAWEQPELLESKKAIFDADLSWSGSPANFQLNIIRGDLLMNVEEGRFNRAAGVGDNPLLRLIGLLNFDTWVRRLKLDFSDVVNSGMAYDRIQSNMHFEPGNLFLAEPLTVKTPSSKMQLAGTINLIDETLDTRLVATLPVGNNLSLWAAFAAGLPAAAGVYVASKLFEKQIDQLSSLSYSIEGPWADPKVNFQRMFDANSAEKTGKTAASAREEARKEADEQEMKELNPDPEL